MPNPLLKHAHPFDREQEDLEREMEELRRLHAQVDDCMTRVETARAKLTEVSDALNQVNRLFSTQSKGRDRT